MKRNIELHDEVFDLLSKKTDDLEKFVNDICFLYAKEGFIRKSDIAGMVTVSKIIRKKSAEGVESFDEITKEFMGIVVTGHSDHDSLFVLSPKLHNLLAENVVVLVMKTPREDGISREETGDTFVKVRHSDMS